MAGRNRRTRFTNVSFSEACFVTVCTPEDRSGQEVACHLGTRTNPFLSLNQQLMPCPSATFKLPSFYNILIVLAFQWEEDAVAFVGMACFTCLPSKDSDNQGTTTPPLHWLLQSTLQSLDACSAPIGLSARNAFLPVSHPQITALASRTSPPSDTISYPGLAWAAVPSVRAPAKILCLDTLTHLHDSGLWCTLEWAPYITVFIFPSPSSFRKILGFKNVSTTTTIKMEEAWGGHTQLLGYLPGVHKALGLIPVTAQRGHVCACNSSTWESRGRRVRTSKSSLAT